MSTIKEFEAAVRSETKPDGEKVTILKIPDNVIGDQKQTFTEIEAYDPGEGQFAALMATMGRGATDMDRVSGAINFLLNIIDERGADYIQYRLFLPDHKDGFGMKEVEDILESLVEEWTGNPTQESSDSTSSPSSPGPRSTGSILS